MTYDDQVLEVLRASEMPLSCREITDQLRRRHPGFWSWVHYDAVYRVLRKLEKRDVVWRPGRSDTGATWAIIYGRA